MTRFCALVAGVLFFLPSGLGWASDPPAVEFFENRIRPILVDHCYACHSTKSGKTKGGLSLDHRAAALKGGDSGPALIPGEPAKSRLISALNYGDVDLQMPPKGKLPASVIAYFETWVKAGAQWAESTEAAGAKADKFDLNLRKQSHWCWQPIKPTAPPAVKDESWCEGPVDKFIIAKLEAASIKPSPAADALTLLRRVSYDLTGLPPTPGELTAFLTNPDEKARIVQAVDRLLASPRFGEHWARHWLDLVRYAETRGHEFDYVAANVWQYRDFVIRALNADVSYAQFVREHFAGDLLPEPRRHPTTGANESILGTCFWWLGEQVHSPVDLRMDEADRIDNQIDVFGKTFLGLTLSCARCHDHKFDALSARDYYSLAAVLASCGYRQVRFEADLAERQAAKALADWRNRVEQETKKKIAHALSAKEWTQPLKVPKTGNQHTGTPIVDYETCRAEDWLPDGIAVIRVKPGDVFVRAGGITIEAEAAAVVDPAWSDLATHPDCQHDAGELGKCDRPGKTIRTPAFTLSEKKVYCRVRGKGLIYLAVQSYSLFEGPLHRSLIQEFNTGPDYRWVAFDVARYVDFRAHVEFTARSPEFAVSQVIVADQPPDSPEEMEISLNQIRSAIDHFATKQCSNLDIRIVAELVRQADANLFRGVAESLFDEQKRMAATPRKSHVAPAMWDGSAVTGRVSIRGNPKMPGEEAPRRLPEAITGTRVIASAGSGRLDIADQLTARDNPLVARVFVNRVWHHLFGRGLVASVDNFGVLGETPSHPELLDYLADRFQREGWSTKRLIRELVLTKTYRQSSNPRAVAAAVDLQNKLLHRAPLKRLGGEAIRDALLLISGRFDPQMYGRPVPVHLTSFMEGRGRPNASGPLDGAGRRSIYLEVRRNFLSPWMTAFDTPTPFTTIGKRTVSNVPAQALMLLNDPFVKEQSDRWAVRVEKEVSDLDQRVDRFYVDAFGRSPSDAERATCQTFIDAHGLRALAHALINVKEFIYIH